MRAAAGYLAAGLGMGFVARRVDGSEPRGAKDWLRYMLCWPVIAPVQGILGFASLPKPATVSPW